MSQAEELLNGLNTDEIAMYTARPEEEPHINVGDDRVIRVPDQLKRLGVQYDHNIETVTFDCPRFWDEHDMSQMKVYINYRTADRKLGSYSVKNVTVDGDIMHFDWTISNEVTKAKGNVAFLVCTRKTDSDGNETNHWNSELCADCYISEGLEASETILRENSDTITFLLTRMDEVNAIATPEAMQKYANTWLEYNRAMVLDEIEHKAFETLQTIPDDYEETYNAAQEALRTKADAVMLDVSGEGIMTVDNSANDHVKGLKLFGKTTQITTTGAQLFDGRKISTLSGNGVTMTNDGTGVISMDGTASAAVSSVNVRIDGLVPGTYYASGMVAGKIFFYVRVTLADGSYKYYKAPTQFTLDGTEQDVLGYLYAPAAGVAFSGEKVYPMLNAGDSPLPWEPYSGGIASPRPDWTQELSDIWPDVQIYGKNLARLGAALNTSVSGISINGNGDSSHVVVDGTVKNACSHVIMRSGLLPPGKYTISVHGLNYHDSANDRLYVTRKSDNALLVNYIQTDRPKTITLTDPAELKIDVVFAAGSTYNNTPISVQIEAGEVATDYEPYVEFQEHQINLALPGIPVSSGGNYTDSNGQQWICDEIDFERGVHVHRVYTFQPTVMASVASGTKNNRGHVKLPYPGLTFKYRSPSAICSHFKYNDTVYNDAGDELGFIVSGETMFFRFTSASDITDTNAGQLWLNLQSANGTPMTVTYILAEPIETELTDIEMAMFLALKTNYHNTTVVNNADAHMEMKYIADTKIYIQEYQPYISDDRIQAAVNAWLDAHFTNAEGVSY